MYSIKDLSLISGLTDRTLRNYLKKGILMGEKKNGVWSFNDEQVQVFLENDYVKASVNSHRNSTVFDFLRYESKDVNTACIVLYLPKENSKEVAKFFCQAVNKRHGLKMSFDQNKGTNKVILVGAESTVYDVLCEYHALEL